MVKRELQAAATVQGPTHTVKLCRGETAGPARKPPLLALLVFMSIYRESCICRSALLYHGPPVCDLNTGRWQSCQQ